MATTSAIEARVQAIATLEEETQKENDHPDTAQRDGQKLEPPCALCVLPLGLRICPAVLRLILHVVTLTFFRVNFV
jgi:hypothetical protein